MNENGNPVIVFDKYEIAPGAYGELEFEIGGAGDGMEETAAGFARKIKEAVAVQNMDALAALDTVRIFTPELSVAVEAADEENLSPSMAGFVLEKDGTPNIIFGVSDGVLAVKGINY